MNMVKELACLAKELLDEDENLPSIGTCTGCGRWGHAFMHCMQCGEDSGQIFFPDPNTDYNSDNKPSDVDTEESENGYMSFQDTQVPMYSRDWHPDCMSGFFDPFRTIPIDTLFSKMYKYIHSSDKEEVTIEQYVLDRCSTMKLFAYTTVPTILQNYDNIVYNIRLYNESYLPKIKPSERPDNLQHFTTEELTLLIKWGVNTLQLHTQQLIQQRDYTTEIFSDPEIINTDNENVKEHCFAMKDLRWNIKQKKFYKVANENNNVRTRITNNSIHAPQRINNMNNNNNIVNIDTNNTLNNTSNNVEHHINIDKAYHMNQTKDNIWLGDSGASCHFTNDDTGMYEWKSIRHTIGTGDGRTTTATKEECEIDSNATKW
jgi:hypothetical protein